MSISFFHVLICLVAGIAIIILLTAKFHVHAFFALMIACLIVGLGVQMQVAEILTAMKEGFGNIMRSLGFLIVLGTTLGVLLEHTGSTKVMAGFILKIVGEKYAVLAIGITGFVVGLPVFCDSGYIVLSGLNKSLAKRTGTSVAVMSASLASGLYAVHCLIPPHPGATAAAGTIGVSIGKLISLGIAVAIPAMIAGFLWANYAGKKIKTVVDEDDEITIDDFVKPSVLKAFLPILIPVLLIACSSFVKADKINTNWFYILINTVGDPVIALSIGILLALNCKRGWKKKEISKLLHDAAEKAGGILVIIGAGGAFGAVLSATHIGSYFSSMNAIGNLGLLLPFLIAFILKTAQGSSTVAIITAASIVQPLLPALGLTSETNKLLCVLSMGGGSMMISHANDAYFWVISKFSGIEMNAMLKVYSLATVFMGLVTLLVVYILFFIL